MFKIALLGMLVVGVANASVISYLGSFTVGTLTRTGGVGQSTLTDTFLVTQDAAILLDCSITALVEDSPLPLAAPRIRALRTPRPT